MLIADRSNGFRQHDWLVVGVEFSVWHHHTESTGNPLIHRNSVFVSVVPSPARRFDHNLERRSHVFCPEPRSHFFPRHYVTRNPKVSGAETGDSIEMVSAPTFRQVVAVVSANPGFSSRPGRNPGRKTMGLAIAGWMNKNRYFNEFRHFARIFWLKYPGRTAQNGAGVVMKSNDAVPGISFVRHFGHLHQGVRHQFPVYFNQRIEGDMDGMIGAGQFLDGINFFFRRIPEQLAGKECIKVAHG